MYRIYVDDMRLCPNGFDRHCYSVNETLNCIRKKYKEGTRQFFLDLDHDAGDMNIDGGDYINILKTLEDLQYSGKLKDCNFQVKLHTMNPVGRSNMQAILKAPYLMEVKG